MQSEREDECHDDRLWLTVTIDAGLEEPLLRRFDGLLIEAKLIVERLDDPHVADGAVRKNDRLELDVTLHFRAHRVARVLGFDLPNQRRRIDAVARPERATTESAARAGTDAVAAA